MATSGITDNVFGVKEVQRSRIWTERSEAFYPLLADPKVLRARQQSCCRVPGLALYSLQYL